MSTDSMPRTVVWVGVGFALGGSLFIAFAPDTLNALLTPNTRTWQSAFLVLGALMQIAKITLAPLGAVLIGAGLVMRYIDRRLTAERIADRPRRMHWPAPPSNHADTRSPVA